MMSDKPSLRDRYEIATPSNAITIVRILLVPVFVAAFLAPWPEWLGFSSAFSNNWKSLVAAIIFVAISATDWLDGYLARSRNEITDFGKFMDPLADKILVAAALICLVELGDLPTWVVLIILAREFIVSGVRMMAASKGVVIAASMVGKFKTVFQMIAIVLFSVKRSSFVSSFGDDFSNMFWLFSWFVMLIALGLTIASMLDYLVKAREVIGLGSLSGTSTPSQPLVPSESKLHEQAVELSRELVANARERGLTISTAESMTGGMIGAFLSTVPGSSNVFKGGVMSYTNEIKHALLDVGEDVLESFGAVSEQVALQMAEGARLHTESDIALSVTGLAGPDGDELGNPVGTVWIGISTGASTRAQHKLFTGGRDSIRLQTLICALEMALEEIRES